MKDFSYIWLWLVCAISMIVTFFKLIDDESIAKETGRKRYTRLGLGVCSSGFYTFFIFETCMHFHLSPSFALAIAGAFSFLGAEFTSELFVKILEQKFNIKLDDKKDKSGD